MRRFALPPALAAGALAALLGGSSCLSYSPHELPPRRDVRGENLEWLESLPPAPRLKFAVVGDVQRTPDEALAAVRRLNDEEDLAFVVQVGDFTDLGLPDEFEIMSDVFDRLLVPWFVVIGNHDLLGDGGAIFDRLFGPRNHDFTYHRTRFVFLDTNSLEYGFGGRVPDLDWLEERLLPSPDHDRTVILSHVWPWSADFDPELRDEFLALLADGQVSLSLHGHDHHYRARTQERVRYFIADHVKQRTFLLVEEGPSGDLDVQRVGF
jgi:3',5'-cyclic-AMP phosphodiesterase